MISPRLRRYPRITDHRGTEIAKSHPVFMPIECLTALGGDGSASGCNYAKLSRLRYDENTRESERQI